MAGSFVDPPLGRELYEHCSGLTAAQRPVASTGDQLLCLHEEFDLADAAAPALDVMAAHRDARGRDARAPAV